MRMVEVLGQFYQTFFAKQKVAAYKKFAIQFDQQLKPQILSLNCQTLFAICPICAPKKLLILFLRKSDACMKLTLRNANFTY